tara:strand:+ start:10470 stop:12716 length:2247 start_codon:yes stop_codon:yes gene_type:complete
MSKLRKITRRSFLIGSASIAGGVAFGTYLAKKQVQNPLLADLKDGQAAITPYVKITSDGITLITPRADMGQGAYSIQANLIAEELDIDPATATITPGMPGPAYYNEAIIGEYSPYPAYDERAIPETLLRLMAIPAKVLEVQVTGGSSTVPDGFEKLRMAGAVARETLKQAAAQRIGIDRSDLTTIDGHVLAPDGTKVAYTDLAAQAAMTDPVTDVTLRPASKWTRLGKSTPRLDMVAKSTGTQNYGIDVQIDGMVHATVRANPALGNDIADIDTSAAQAMTGVLQVLPVQYGIAVVANNTWTAFQAAQTIDITWEKSDFPKESAQIYAALTAAVGNPDALDQRPRDDGDVDRALQNETVVSARYQIPYLAHAPLEPMNATVRITDDACEIWTGTQIPLFVRNRAAALTGLDRAQVFVYAQTMGGSFGHRLEMTHVEQAVQIAMAMQGTAVKMTWSREEDMTHDYPRPAAVAMARGTVLAGKINSFDLSVGQSGLAAPWIRRMTGVTVPGPDATLTKGAWDQPFGIPNYRVTGYRAPDMVPVSSWRSVGASGNGFFHDSFLDELIHAAGADPLAERIRLCIHDTSRKVLEAVGEMANWGAPMGPDRGRGVAFCMSFGVPCAQVVEVTNTNRGIKIDRVYAAVDVGHVLDPVNLEAQVFGGVLFGLGHAMSAELSYADYQPEQTNFDGYPSLRLYQTPQVTVKALSNGSSIRGIGEPGVPPAAPALANAIFATTGQRIRTLPLNKSITFV